MAQKILILDDEEHYAQMLYDILTQHNFLVDMATKPLFALELLEDKDYQLVISDYKMPVMDGASFLQKARKVNPFLPVILVSGLMNVPELIKVANMGVTCVLEKPLDTDVFLENVKRFVSPLSPEELEQAKQEAEGGGPSRDLVSEALELNYPDLSFLTDVSEVSQRFIQSLYDTVKNNQHVFLCSHPGTESELIMREVSLWKGEQATEVQTFSVLELISPDSYDFFKELSNKPEMSRVIGVTGVAEATVPQQEMLRHFIEEDYKLLPNHEEVQFLYFFDVSLFSPENTKVFGELMSLARRNLVVVPPLRERLSDLAVYAQNYLRNFAEQAEAPDRMRLTQEAIACMLQYEWPGNFQQLLEVLWDAVNLKKEGALTAKDLTSVLDTKNYDTSMLEMKATSLKDNLLRRQKQVIGQTARVYKDQWPKVFSALHINISMLKEDQTRDNFEFLYPDLITPKGK